MDLLANLHPVQQALAATLFTWLVTAAGAAIVFFVRSVRANVLDAMNGFAAGVMIAGCAENDCFHRSGNEWTLRRVLRERDPRLRQRVPSERVELAWLPLPAHGRRAKRLREFRERLGELGND